jgi:hypothetical protein
VVLTVLDMPVPVVSLRAPGCGAEVARMIAVTPILHAHSPLIVCGVPGTQIWSAIISCSCGWRVPPNVADSDTAMSEHIAIARVSAGASP